MPCFREHGNSQNSAELPLFFLLSFFFFKSAWDSSRRRAHVFLKWDLRGAVVLSQPYCRCCAAFSFGDAAGNGTRKRWMCVTTTRPPATLFAVFRTSSHVSPSCRILAAAAEFPPLNPSTVPATAVGRWDTNDE